MTNEQLKAFVAVVEKGSFRSAANSLYKTQPSISAAVKLLEQQFEFSLFDRKHYRPVLTSKGKAFFRQAKKLLKQTAELEVYAHQLASVERPQLSISLSVLSAFPPVLDKIKSFWNQHPQMQLQLNTEHLSGVLEQIQLEKSELAIGPLMGIDQQYDVIKISHIEMITVASPLLLNSNDRHHVSQQTLRNLPHILISDTGSMAPFDHINIIAGGQTWNVNDYQMKKNLLISGMGWGRIPEHVVSSQLADGSLVKLQVENFNSQSTVPMYLIKLKQQSRSQLAKLFWDDMLTLNSTQNSQGL